jgi:hypothetical protein
MQVPSASLANPMQIPFFAYSQERSRNGSETEVERYYNGIITDLVLWHILGNR